MGDLNAKVQRGIVVLAISNFAAAILFSVGYFMTHEIWYMIAAALMVLAGVGVFILSTKIKGMLNG